MSYCINKMADICAFIQNSIVILNKILRDLSALALCTFF